MDAIEIRWMREEARTSGMRAAEMGQVIAKLTGSGRAGEDKPLPHPG